MDERRAAFIQGLRDLATFLETHPDVAYGRYHVLNAFMETREQIATQARAATWEKVYNDSWFYLERKFGEDLSLQVNVPRGEVCRKVITGKRLVPAQAEHEQEEYTWICDEPSLLTKAPFSVEGSRG